jgi:hypothetical protein
VCVALVVWHRLTFANVCCNWTLRLDFRRQRRFDWQHLRSRLLHGRHPLWAAAALRAASRRWRGRPGVLPLQERDFRRAPNGGWASGADQTYKVSAYAV